jgi:hypothetical protein
VLLMFVAPLQMRTSPASRSIFLRLRRGYGSTNARHPDHARGVRRMDASPWDEAAELQKPLPDDRLVEVMRGAEKEDKAA